MIPTIILRDGADYYHNVRSLTRDPKLGIIGVKSWCGFHSARQADWRRGLPDVPKCPMCKEVQENA